ncbi:OmpH family outer membrane protein [Candidatus Margulisiibacteriota bacterium]
MAKKMFALILGILLISSQAYGAASSIGYVDLQKTLKAYKNTAKTQKELDKKQKAYQEDFTKFQKKLSDAENSGKSKNELEKMRKDMETKLSKNQSEIMAFNQQFNSALQSKILKAAGAISKRLGLDLVMDKQAVIVGGLDITDMLITEINK